MPYRELGVDVERRTRRGLILGLQASVRSDSEPYVPDTPGVFFAVGGVNVGGSPGGEGGGEPGAPPAEVIRATQRWRVAPRVGRDWGRIRGTVGLVAGDYYNPRAHEKGSVWIYPQASLGVGSPDFDLELGFMDAPATASSAAGGMGVLAIRSGMLLAPRHRIVIGAGAPYAGPGESIGGRAADGYVSYAYEGRVSDSLSLNLGGYTSTAASGLFVTVARAFPW